MTSYNSLKPEEFFADTQLDMGRAILGADMPRIEQLLPQVDLNAHGKHGISLLLLAVNQAIPEQDNANSMRWQVIRRLVQAGAAVDDQSTEAGQISPLSIALKAKSPYFLRALLDGGMSPNATLYREPILPEVARDASLDSLKLLVERGAHVNARDSLGETALFGSSAMLQVETVKYLLSNGADVSVVNRAGVSYGWSLKIRFERADANNPQVRQMMAIQNNLVKEGKLKWPPDEPLTERDRMRARGETPIIPAGQTR